MPVSSCSAPIGSAHGDARARELLLDLAERAVEVGPLAVEHVHEDDARQAALVGTLPRRGRCRPRRPSRRSPRRAPRLPRSAPRSRRPGSPASPGVSRRLIFRPCQSAWQTEAARDICRLCSSSSQSATVVPDSTVPSRLTAPDWYSIASTSDVFPVPRWPTTATLRIFPGSAYSHGRDPLLGTSSAGSLTPSRPAAASYSARAGAPARPRAASAGAGSPSCAAARRATRSRRAPRRSRAASAPRSSRG